MKKSVVYAIFAILLVLVAVLAYLFLSQRKEMNEMVEQMTIEKEELEDEYEDLAIQFDGYQQMDARRIAELKKELATVRAVMKDYVRQIDSLNATNARLTVENQQVRQENQQYRSRNEELTQANTELTETVTRAAMLEITSNTVTMLNKSDKRTRMSSHARKLQFDFVIAKNITCTPGMKDLYVRVITPAGELMDESENKLFAFESGEIPYSLTQQIEYSGEAYSGTCYCPLGEGEKVQPGFYTVDFFCEGNLIGSFPFQLKK